MIADAAVAYTHLLTDLCCPGFDAAFDWGVSIEASRTGRSSKELEALFAPRVREAIQKEAERRWKLNQGKGGIASR